MQQQLTKKERKRLAKQNKRQARERQEKMGKLKKLTSILVIVGLIVAFGMWLNRESTKPQPGETATDLGRTHVTDIGDVTYNSNPPTSGDHFAIWAKKGIYDRVISDGYLIHSLEHGYVVLSYNCNIKQTGFRIIPQALAHEDDEPHEEPIATESASGQPLTQLTYNPGSESWFTPSNPPPTEIELPEVFNSPECTELVGQLSQFVDDYDRVIAVPRLDLDTRIALTAWTNIDKFNDFDQERIKTFIKAFRNKGPEATVE